MFKRVITSIIILLIALALTIGAAAATNLEVISAYINHDVNVEYEGKPQQMYDVLGNEVYPIIYEGTTYLPVRALAELFEVDVHWNDDTETVELGDTDLAVDLIDDMTPYAGNYSQSNGLILSIDEKTKSIAGISCDHWMYFENTQFFYYNLENKYTALDFSAYCSDSSRNNSFELRLYGDGKLIESFEIDEFALPTEHTVDLNGVSQLRICAENPDGNTSSSEIYLFNMKLS